MHGLTLVRVPVPNRRLAILPYQCPRFASSCASMQTITSIPSSWMNCRISSSFVSPSSNPATLIVHTVSLFCSGAWWLSPSSASAETYPPTLSCAVRYVTVDFLSSHLLRRWRRSSCRKVGGSESLCASFTSSSSLVTCLWGRV